MHRFVAATALAICLAAAACSPREVRAPSAPASAPTPPEPLQTGNTYFDLKPGWRLRIVVPLLKAGGGETVQLDGRREGDTITLSAPNLAGYQVSRYDVEDGGGSGKVRLRFLSAETTRDGKTLPETAAPPLPFRLPRTAQHIRLIYLIRQSSADHNMAIAAAKRREALEAFTDRFLHSPGVCADTREVSCAWVPAQAAVTPQDGSGKP